MQPWEDPSTIIALLGGFIIPLLVGIVTKVRLASGWKAVINALLTSLLGGLATLFGPEGWQWGLFLWNVSLAWAMSVATHFGLWKPSGATESVAESTRGFGVG